MVHEGAQEMILPRRNARSVDCRAGTWCERTLSTVGDDDAGVQVTATVFSLSVKATMADCVTRDQPSGTFTANEPFDDWNRTYCVVSGMSPGGLLSTGTGFSPGDRDAVVPEGPVAGVDPPGEAPCEPPLHADRKAAAASRTATAAPLRVAPGPCRSRVVHMNPGVPRRR